MAMKKGWHSVAVTLGHKVTILTIVCPPQLGSAHMPEKQGSVPQPTSFPCGWSHCSCLDGALRDHLVHEFLHYILHQAILQMRKTEARG